MGMPGCPFFDGAQQALIYVWAGNRFHKKEEAMAILLLTNNPLVNQKLQQEIAILFEAHMDYLGILKEARNRIHQGAVLLTHPLSGSIKPSETPFKSLLLEDGKKTLDTASLQIIEDALRLAERMIEQTENRKWTDRILADFQLIDYDLIRHGLEHAKRHQ